MKIKHFRGYGSVEATRVNKYDEVNYGEKFHVIKIRVVGDHECGIKTHDDYTAFYWLLRKFVRGMGHYHNYYVDMTADYDYSSKVDTCVYTFKYHEK